MCTLTLDYCVPILREHGIVSPQASMAFRIVAKHGGSDFSAFESARAAELGTLPKHSRAYEEIDHLPNPYRSAP